MRRLLIDFVPGLFGGVVGGVVGYFLVLWIRRQGFYAPVLPGALFGLGCGLASRTDSNPRGMMAAAGATLAGLITEWIIFYQPAEKTLASFGQFLTELPGETTLTKVLLLLGTVLGFWWGRECTMRSRLIGRKPEAEDD